MEERSYSNVVDSAWWYNLGILGAVIFGFFSVAVLALWLKNKNKVGVVWFGTTGGLILASGLMWKVAPSIGFWGLFIRDLMLMYLAGFLCGLFSLKKKNIQKSRL